MGFTNASQNRAALIAADNNVESAIGILLNGGITDNTFGTSASSMLAASRKASDLAPHRVEDSTVKSCPSCGKEFSGMVFAVKRHHCEIIGNILRHMFSGRCRASHGIFKTRTCVSSL